MGYPRCKKWCHRKNRDNRQRWNWLKPGLSTTKCHLRMIPALNRDLTTKHQKYCGWIGYHGDIIGIWLTGWWLFATPPKNHGVKVSWDDDIPPIKQFIDGKSQNSCSKPPTSWCCQYVSIPSASHSFPCIPIASVLGFQAEIWRRESISWNSSSKPLTFWEELRCSCGSCYGFNHAYMTCYNYHKSTYLAMMGWGGAQSEVTNAFCLLL